MTPFDQLGLAPAASPAEVKARWRQLASEHHPDHGGDAAQFHALHQAYKQALYLAGRPKRCPTCAGTGLVEQRQGFHAVKWPCGTCRGRGVIDAARSE